MMVTYRVNEIKYEPSKSINDQQYAGNFLISTFKVKQPKNTDLSW